MSPTATRSYLKSNDYRYARARSSVICFERTLSLRLLLLMPLLHAHQGGDGNARGLGHVNKTRTRFPPRASWALFIPSRTRSGAVLFLM